MNIVNWKDIIAECGNYKAAFVATFHKYEGMPTDEHASNGRVVKVTSASFAEHMGIPHRTFSRWVRASLADSANEGAAKAAAKMAAEGKAGTVRSAKNLAKKDPAALVDAIEAAGPQAAGHVYADLTRRRYEGKKMPKKPTKADVKGKKAKAAEAGEAIESGINTSLLKIIPAQLAEISEEVEGAIAKGTLSLDLLTEIEEAAQRLLNTVQAGKVFVA